MSVKKSHSLCFLCIKILGFTKLVFLIRAKLRTYNTKQNVNVCIWRRKKQTDKVSLLRLFDGHNSPNQCLHLDQQIELTFAVHAIILNG